MASKLLVLLACALLCACGPKAVAVKRDPIPENCNAACRTPCTVDPAIVYAPVPGSIDALNDLVVQVVIPLGGEVPRCDIHRQACVQCLDRLKEAGITQ